MQDLWAGSGVPCLQRGCEEARGGNHLEKQRLGLDLKWLESGAGIGVGRGGQRRAPPAPHPPPSSHAPPSKPTWAPDGPVNRPHSCLTFTSRTFPSAFPSRARSPSWILSLRLLLFRTPGGNADQRADPGHRSHKRKRVEPLHYEPVKCGGHIQTTVWTVTSPKLVC